MPGTFVPMDCETGELCPPPAYPYELDEPSWGEGAASALHMLRSLEQRRQLMQPTE
jgi:hypothetical protein